LTDIKMHVHGVYRVIMLTHLDHFEEIK